MEPLVHAYWTAKLGSSAEEYEDAFAYSANNRHFAVADGATESSFADRWARSLVQKYSRECPAPAGGAVSLPEWVEPLQKEWREKINWNELPWYAEEKARLGAFSTLLGLSFASPEAKKPAAWSPMNWFRRKKEPPRSDKLAWRAFAIGDSCLFHVRGNALICAFPLTKASQFNSRPLLLCSNPNNNTPVWNAVATAEGGCQPGDRFFALTDALAKWFLDESEAQRAPWTRLAGIRNAPAFEKLVEQLRSSKAMRNDDTTMLSIHWPAAPENPGTPPVSPRKGR